MNNVHFAIPEIYGDSLSYYELLMELVTAMNEVIENYDTIPDQIAEAVKDIDASQLFSAVLEDFINGIATDNTKSANAAKLYKKHDLLYATFNETVNLYESLIDFTTGAETELIVGTNIREVNISELFIELRELIDNEKQTREQADTDLQNAINTETSAREQGDTTLRQSITAETSAREQADTSLQNAINAETARAASKETELKNDIDDTKTSVLNEIKAWVNNSQHPVGSIYVSLNSTSPASLFGGTWERLKDRFLLAAGDTYEAGSTGGESQHTLTVNEIPGHTHTIENGTVTVSGGNVGNISYANNNSILASTTNSRVTDTGGSQPHNNMPPYLCVYMWKRIS